MKIYAIVDRKAQVVSGIFTAVNDDSAVRSFEDLLFRPEDTVFNQHFDDFILYVVGNAAVIPETGLLFDAYCRVICEGSSYSRAIIESRRLENQEFLEKMRKIHEGE